jgi:hypothetical protein
MGETATGAFTVEDDAAALTLIGYQPINISDSTCSQPRLFTGWTFERGYQRDEENAILTSVARTHDVSIIDMNACFGFRQMDRAGGASRPAETWAQRLTWILGSEYLSPYISADQSFVVTNTTAMDAADYTGSYPSAVMQDLSDRSGNAYDYFAFWNPSTKAVTLFFDNDVESIADSVLRISNVLSDQDQWITFGPDKLAKLQRESDQVYSDVVVNYADGTLKLYRHRPTTAAAFVRRGTQIDRPYTRSVATATLQAEAFLDKHSYERDRVTCVIRVPASRAGLVQAGQRIQFKAPHMPGYDDFTWMRVVMCTPKPANEAATHYDIALELVGVPVVVTEGAYAILTWAGSDRTDGYAGYVDPPWRASYQNNGNFPHAGDPNEYRVPITGPLQYVNADGSTPAPGPYTAGDFSDRARGIKCLADGVVDVRFALTGIQVYMDSFTIDIYLNGASVASQLVTGGAPDYGKGIVYKTGLVVASGDVIEGWMSAEVDAYLGYVAVPYGVGAAATEHLKVTGIMGGSDGSDTVIDLGPTAGATTTTHAVDPTVDDDETLGYTTPGMIWVNTATGDTFIRRGGRGGRLERDHRGGRQRPRSAYRPHRRRPHPVRPQAVRRQGSRQHRRGNGRDRDDRPRQRKRL